MPHSYNPTVQLGLALRKLRRDRHLSQAGLAARCGLNQSTIQRIERGDHERPQEQTLNVLALGLGLPLGQLKHILGLGTPLAQPPAVTGSATAEPLGLPLQARADRLVQLFLNLTPSQQDRLESMALLFHSTRYSSQHQQPSTEQAEGMDDTTTTPTREGDASND